MPYLARTHRVFAIDLLGYGYSDKPNPRDFPQGTLYTFETWAQQLLDFCDQFAGGPVFMICNSVGGERISTFPPRIFLRSLSGNLALVPTVCNTQNLAFPVDWY